MEQLLSYAAEFGPLWLLVFVIAFLLWHFGTKFMEIYSAKLEAQAKLDDKREERKRKELESNIEHDREMAALNGQMIETMRESNHLMETNRTIMEAIVTSNEMIHEDLKSSQAGSRQMQSDMQIVKQQVDVLYKKGI